MPRVTAGHPLLISATAAVETSVQAHSSPEEISVPWGNPQLMRDKCLRPTLQRVILNVFYVIFQRVSGRIEPQLSRMVSSPTTHHIGLSSLNIFPNKLPAFKSLTQVLLWGRFKQIQSHFTDEEFEI